MWPSWFCGVSNGSDIRPPNGVVSPFGRVLDQFKLLYKSMGPTLRVRFTPYRSMAPRFADGVYRIIDRCIDRIAGDRIVRQDHQPVEPVCHIPCTSDGGLNKAFVGGVQVQVRAEQMNILQTVGWKLENVAVAKPRGVPNSVARAECHLLVDVIPDGDAVELIVDERTGGCAATLFVIAIVHRRHRRSKDAARLRYTTA